MHFHNTGVLREWFIMKFNPSLLNVVGRRQRYISFPFDNNTSALMGKLRVSGVLAFSLTLNVL